MPAPRDSGAEPHFVRGCRIAATRSACPSSADARKSRVPEAAPPSDKSLAILPFVVTGADTANSYLGEGIADEVTNTLAQVPGLRIAGRGSAARFARTAASVQDVAAGSMCAVLDGTVRRAVIAFVWMRSSQMARDGLVLWRDSFERPAKDMFTVQDEIARAIAGQLQLTLSGAAASAERGTHDATAYDLYLKGMYLFRRRGAGLAEAALDLQQATVRDTNFARAWAGLARRSGRAQRHRCSRGRRDSQRSCGRRARRATRFHAVGGAPRTRLRDGRVVPLGCRGNRTSSRDRARSGRRGTSISTRLSPSNMQRPAEAVPVLQQAKARDPMYFLIATYLGTAQLDMNQIAEGIAEQRRGLELEPANVAALSTMARGYMVAGMPDSAKAVARRLIAVTQSPGRLGTASSSSHRR